MRRISAIAGAVTLAIAVLLPATAAAASTWNYSCEPVSADFAYNGSGYTGFGETIHFAATGCWSATTTSATSFSPTITRSWEDDGTFYRDSSGASSSTMHSGYSVFWANYHVSVWYESDCDPVLPFLCGEYPAAYAMHPILEIIPSNQPGFASWSYGNACPFITGNAWVSNCSYSLASFSRGAITIHWISGPAS
jgi:hypothetical protein